jgi:hypothetical protein
MPRDARSLLKTPTNQTIVMLGNGEYTHIGVKNSLQSISSRYNLTDANKIEMQINIDGIPLSSSSQVDLWPILGRVMSDICSEVFTVGIFCGTGKPASFNDFIEQFVKEMQEIGEQGGIYLPGSDKPVPVDIQNFICDTPARAFAKMTRGHNYHQGCDRCQQEGEYMSNRMTFQHTDTPASHRLY